MKDKKIYSLSEVFEGGGEEKVGSFDNEVFKLRYVP